MKAEITKTGILEISADTITEAYAINRWADNLIAALENNPKGARQLINADIFNKGWGE